MCGKACDEHIHKATSLVATSEWSRVDKCRYPQVHAENGRLLAVFRIVVAVREHIMSLSLA